MTDIADSAESALSGQRTSTEELHEHAPAAPDHSDHGEHGGHHSSLGLSNMKLAMWLFLGSECLLFGALISTFLLSKARFMTELLAGNPKVLETIPAGIAQEFIEAGSVEPIYDIPFTSGSSFILLMSSLTMVLAHKAVGEDDDFLTKVWLGATALLGSTFIAGQVYEFTVFYREGIEYGTSLYGSAFYTLTGFHGVHVTGGILMLLSLLMLAFQGKLKSNRAETVELVGLYWHFVDVVWVLIFTIVYLIP